MSENHPIYRRRFLRLASLAALASASVSHLARAAGATPGIKAVAFDAFPIFDPRPIFALAEELFPGRGGELSNLWRIRQFEYTWLRSLSNRYADFWQVTEEALLFAGTALKIEIDPPKRDRLMQAYLELNPWPDVVPALDALKNAGLRLGFLSNFTPSMLESNIRHAALGGRFEQVLSTDAAKTYKPAPLAYQLGLDAFGLRREEILFVAFAGWDAAGAKSFGFPTFWANRLNAPMEELGVKPDGLGRDLSNLASFVKG